MNKFYVAIVASLSKSERINCVVLACISNFCIKVFQDDGNFIVFGRFRPFFFFSIFDIYFSVLVFSRWTWTFMIFISRSLADILTITILPFTEMFPVIPFVVFHCNKIPTRGYIHYHRSGKTCTVFSSDASNVSPSSFANSEDVGRRLKLKWDWTSNEIEHLFIHPLKSLKYKTLRMSVEKRQNSRK